MTMSWGAFAPLWGALAASVGKLLASVGELPRLCLVIAGMQTAFVR